MSMQSFTRRETHKEEEHEKEASLTTGKRERLLKLAWGVYKRVPGGRIVVSLAPETGKNRDAYLDPARIKKVIVTEEKRDEDTVWKHYYIIYESDNPFYDKFEHKRIVGKVIKEGGIELLHELPDRVIRREGNKWRVYLRELGKWDNFLWDFSTAVKIWETNIHPYYGVMD